MPPQMKSIDHVHVLVADRTVAESWYEKVLGFKRVKELEFWAQGGGPLTIQNREGTVHLALFEGATAARPPTVAFGVDSTEFIRWQAHLGEMLETQIQLEDHTMSWSLYFNDPDGNRFEITSYEYAAIESEFAKRDA